jgi:predicted transcriptional regulator
MMPTLADTIALPPQTRKILNHLEQRRTISPMEAIITYGATRLSARIRELRQAGFIINTTFHRDAEGKPYGRYTLVR